MADRSLRCVLASFALAGAATSCGTSSSDVGASTDASSEAPDAGAALRANGTVSAWQTLAPMPHRRANFCAAVVGEYVVAIGGNYPDDGGFTKLDEIDVARFHDDGSLDPWVVAGHAPSPVTECTATGDGDTLYLLDGIYDDASKQGHVFSASLVGGTFGTFSELAPLPAGDDLFDDLAFVTSGRVVATTSKLSGSCALLSGSVASQLAPWTDVDWFPEFRGRPQWATAVAGGTQYVYVLGGYSDADAGNGALQTGAGAPIAADGTTGSSFATTPLPKATTFGMGAFADDWVFVIGGRAAIFGAQPTTDVVSAQAGASGALGAWSAQPPLPSPLSNGCAVVAGNFLYVLGGANTTATDTVFAGQVRF
jgi:hypothetical protein